MSETPEAACIAFEGERCVASGDLREVARALKQALDRGKDGSILVFDGMSSSPIEIDFRGTVEDVLARLPEAGDMAPAAAEAEADIFAEPRARPAKTGRGRARNHVAAATLGLAGATAGRSVGCDPQTGRGSAARRRRQGSHSPGAGGGLSFHVRDGRQPAALRRCDPRVVCGRTGPFRKIDRRMAQRCARSCRAAGGTRFSPRSAAARRLIPRRRTDRLLGMIGII